MQKLIKKYSILVIVIVGLQHFLEIFTLDQLQVFLMDKQILKNLTLFYFPYIKNIILAFIILRDLVKHNIKGVPVVLLTIFSHFAGVIFFLFLIHSKSDYDDR